MWGSFRTARNLRIEARRSVVRIRCRKHVFRFDAGDEAGVARQALISNLVRWPIHPRLRVFRLVANHESVLGELFLVADGGGALDQLARVNFEDGFASG